MAGIVDYFDVNNDQKYTDALHYPHIITKDKAKHWRYHSRNESNIQELRLLVDSILEQGRVRGHLTIRLTNERCLPRSLIFKQKRKHIPKFRTFSSRVYVGYIDQFPLNYIAKGLADTSVHSYVNTSLGNSNAKYTKYLRQSQSNLWVNSVAKYSPKGLFFKAIHTSTYRSSKFKYKIQIKDYQRALKMHPEKLKRLVKNLCNLSVMGYKEWCWYMFSKYYLWRSDSDNELRYDRLLNLTYPSTRFNKETLIGPPIRKKKDNRRALVILNISRHITKTSAGKYKDSLIRPGEEPEKTVAFKSVIPTSANVSCGRRERIIVINTERLNFRLLYYVLENLFQSGKKIGCLYAKSNLRHLLGKIKRHSTIIKQINKIRKWPGINKYSKTVSMLKKRSKQYIQGYLIKLYKRFHKVKTLPELILIQEFVEDTESSFVSKMKSTEIVKNKMKPKIAKSMTAPGKVEQIEAQVKKGKKGKRSETAVPRESAIIDKKALQKKNANKKTKGGQNKKDVDEVESKHELAKVGSAEMEKEDNKKATTRKRSPIKGKMKPKRRIGASPSKFSIPPKEELCEYPPELPATPMEQLADKKETKPKSYEPFKQIFRNKTMSRRYFNIYGTAKQHITRPTITGKLIQAPFKRTHYNKYLFPCLTHIYDIVHYPEQIKFAMNDAKLLTERLLEIKTDFRNRTLKKNRKHKFIIISTLLTWANTPTHKKKEKISEALFQKRVPNSQYIPQYHFENYIVDASKLGLFEVLIIGVGLVYGDESIDLQAMFRLAMEGKNFIPVFGKGRNYVPIIHVHEITRFIKMAIDDFPEVPYIFLTEPKVWTQNDLVRRLSLQFCNHVEKVATYRSLHFHIPKYLNDMMTCNFKTRFTYANNILSWGNKSTVRQNLRPAIRDYIRSKRMEPLRIALYGPPCAGKTYLAKILAKYYDVKYISMAELIAAYVQVRDYFLKWTIGREMTVLWRIKQRWLRNEKSRLLKLLKTTLREKFVKCLEKLAEEEKKGPKNVPSSPIYLESSEEEDSSTSDVEDISHDDSMESEDMSLIEGEEDAVETEEIPQILDFVPDHIYLKKKTNTRSIGSTVNYSIKSKIRFNKKIKDNVKKRNEKQKKILAKRVASEKFNIFVKRIKDIIKRKNAEDKQVIKGERKIKKHKPGKRPSLESTSKQSMVVVKDVLKKMQKDKLIKKKRGSSSKRKTFRTSKPGNEKLSRLTLQPFRRFVTSDIIQSDAEDVAGIYIGPYKLYGKYLKIDRIEEDEEKDEGKPEEEVKFEFTWKGIFLNWDERRPEWEVDSPVAWNLPWMMPWTAKRIQAALDAVTLPYVVTKEEAYRQRMSFQGEEKSLTDLKDIDESRSDEIKDLDEDFYDADEVVVDADEIAAAPDTDDVEPLIGDTYFEVGDEFGTSEIEETYSEKETTGRKDRRRKSFKEEIQFFKKDTKDKKEIVREKYKEYLLKIERLRKASLAKAKKERQKKLTSKKQKKKQMLSKEAEEKVEFDKEEKKMVEKIKRRKSKRMKLLKRPRKIRKLTDNDRVAWSVCMFRCCPTCCPLQFSRWFVDSCNFVIREKHKCCKALQYKSTKSKDQNVNQLANRFLKRKMKVRPMVNLFRFKSKTRLLQKKLSNMEKVNNYFSDKRTDVCLVPSSTSSPGSEDEEEIVDETNVDDKPKDTLKAITIMPAILRKFEKFQFRQSIRSKMTSFMRGIKKLKRAREYIVNQIKNLTKKLRDANYKVLFRFLSYLTDVDRRSTLKDLPESVDRLTLRQSRLASKRKKRRKTSRTITRGSKKTSLEKRMAKRSSFEKQPTKKVIQDKPAISRQTADPKAAKPLDRTKKQSKPGLDQTPKQPVGQKITDPKKRKGADEKVIGATLVQQLRSLSELQDLHRQEENRASIITHTKEMYIDIDYLFETKKKIQNLHKYRSFIAQWRNTRTPNIRPKKYFRFIFMKRKHRRKIRPFLKILQQDWGEKYDITSGRKPRKVEMEDTKFSVGVQCVESGHIRTMRSDDVLYPIRIYSIASDGLRTIMSVKFNVNERYFSGDDEDAEDYERDLQDIFEKSDDASEKEKKRKKKPKKGEAKKNRRFKDIKDRAMDERRWRKKKKIQDKYYKIITRKIEQSKLVEKIKKKSMDDKKYFNKKFKRLKIVSPFNKNKKGKKKGKGGKKGKKLAIIGKARGGKEIIDVTLYNFIVSFTNKKVYRNIKEKIQKHFIKLFKFINTLSMQEDIQLDLPTYLLSTLQAFTKDNLKYAPKFDYNLLSKSLNAGANIRYKNFLDNPKQYIFTGNIQVFQLKKLKKKKRYRLISMNDKKLQIKSRHSQIIKKNDTKPNGNIYNIKTVIKQNYRQKNMKLINKLKNKPLKKYKLGFARIRQLLDERCINFIEPTKQQNQNIKQALQEVKKFKVGENTDRYHCHKTAFNPNRRAHKLIKYGYEVPRFIYKHFINSNRYHQLSNNYFWIQNYEVVRRCIQNVNQKRKRIYQEWNWRWLVRKRSPLRYIWNSKLCNTRQQILRINHRLKFISWQRKKEQIRQYVHMYSLENLKSIDIKDLPELLKHSMSCYAPKKNRILTHCIDLLVKIWESAVLFQYENDENMIATIMGEILRMNEYKTKGYVLDGLPMSSMAAKVMFKPRFTELFHKKQLKTKMALVKFRRKAKTRHKLKVKNVAKIRNHLRRRAQLVGDYARSTNLHSMVIDRFKEFLSAVKMGQQRTIEIEGDPKRYSVLSEDLQELKISPATAREKLFNRWKYMKLLKSRLDLEEKYNPVEFKKVLVKSLPAEEYTYICEQLGLSRHDRKDPIFSNLDYSLVQAWKTTLQEVIELLELNSEINKKVTRAKGANSLKHLVQNMFPKRAKLSNIKNVASLENYINLAKRKFKKGTRSYRNLNVRTFTTLKRMYPDEDILETLNDDKLIDTQAQQSDDKKRGDEKADNPEYSDDQLSNGTQYQDEDFFTDDSEAVPDQVVNEIQKPLSECYKRLRIYAPRKQITFPLVNVKIPKPKTILKILKYRSKMKLKTMEKIKNRHFKDKRKQQKMYNKQLKHKKLVFLKNLIKHIIERRRNWKAKYICLPKNERPKKFINKAELIVKLKNLITKLFKKERKSKEDKAEVKRILYIQRKLDEKRDKSIKFGKDQKVKKDEKCKHKNYKKEKEDRRKKKHKRKDKKYKQAVSSDKFKKKVKPGLKKLNKPELNNAYSLAKDKNAVNHKYRDKKLSNVKKPRKQRRQSNQITKYKPEILINKKYKQNTNSQKSITAKGKLDNLSKKVPDPKKMSKVITKKLEQNKERKTKFSEKPLVLLDPIFENKFHDIAMEQLDPQLSINRSDNMNLTYRVIRMPSLTKLKRKLKQKKKYMGSHVSQRKLEMQSLPLCDCQKGFRLPVISFPTKQNDRYFLCNIKRILKMQPPSGPRIYINQFGKLVKEEICVPKKHVFVNASVRVPHIKRLKKKLNVQTNYMPQWVFNITRRATYLRTFSKCDNLIEMSTIYKRINFYWFHDSLNPTFLDFMNEKDVPVWTFNIKSRTDENVKKLFMKLTEIIGPAKRKASPIQPDNPSWIKNYPLNINLELSDKYNINICADVARDPDQIWQDKCLNPITKETREILNKYFEKEAKHGEVLNQRLLTEKEVRNILEVEQQKKQREAIFQNYIDQKVKSVGKHLFWHMKQFYKLRIYAKKCIMQQMFIPLAMVVNLLQDQSDVESEGATSKSLSPGGRSTFSYLDDIEKTSLTDFYPEPLIEEDEEPGSTFTIPSFDDEVSDGRDSLKIPIESRGLLEENMLEYLNYTKSIPSSKTSLEITDDQIEEIPSERYKGEELVNEEGRKEIMEDEFMEGEQVGETEAGEQIGETEAGELLEHEVMEEELVDDEYPDEDELEYEAMRDKLMEEEIPEEGEEEELLEEELVEEEQEINDEDELHPYKFEEHEKKMVSEDDNIHVIFQAPLMDEQIMITEETEVASSEQSSNTIPSTGTESLQSIDYTHSAELKQFDDDSRPPTGEGIKKRPSQEEFTFGQPRQEDIIEEMEIFHLPPTVRSPSSSPPKTPPTTPQHLSPTTPQHSPVSTPQHSLSNTPPASPLQTPSTTPQESPEPTPSSSTEELPSLSPLSLDSPLSLKSLQNAHLLLESFVEDMDLIETHTTEDIFDQSNLKQSEDLFQPTLDDKDEEFKVHDFYDEIAISLIKWTEPPKKSIRKVSNQMEIKNELSQSLLNLLELKLDLMNQRKPDNIFGNRKKKESHK